MIDIFITAALIFIISLIFSMFGKGGGELYLPVMLTLLGMPYYTVAGVNLFLIFIQSISMIFVYSRKHKLIDWKLAFLLALIVGTASFTGGSISAGISPVYLKVSFAAFLIISAILLFLNKKIKLSVGKFGVWHRKFDGGEYDIHIVYLSIAVFLAAFLAGMVGISGGGLIVPIAVLLGGMPLRIAMGTNTFLVLAASSMGFAGHAINGGVDWRLCAIFGAVVIIASQIGSHAHKKVNEKHLRVGLAFILVFAALWMIVKIFL